MPLSAVRLRSFWRVRDVLIHRSIGDLGKRRWTDRRTDFISITYDMAPPDAPNVTWRQRRPGDSNLRERAARVRPAHIRVRSADGRAPSWPSQASMCPETRVACPSTQAWTNIRTLGVTGVIPRVEGARDTWTHSTRLDAAPGALTPGKVESTPWSCRQVTLGASGGARS